MALPAEFGAHRGNSAPHERQTAVSGNPNRSQILFQRSSDIVPSHDVVIDLPGQKKATSQGPIVSVTDQSTEPTENSQAFQGPIVSRRYLLRRAAAVGFIIGADSVLAACGRPEQPSFGEVPASKVSSIINSLSDRAQLVYSSGKYETTTAVKKQKDAPAMRFFSIKYVEDSFDQSIVPNDNTPFRQLAYTVTYGLPASEYDTIERNTSLSPDQRRTMINQKVTDFSLTIVRNHNKRTSLAMQMQKTANGNWVNSDSQLPSATTDNAVLNTYPANVEPLDIIRLGRFNQIVGHVVNMLNGE